MSGHQDLATGQERGGKRNIEVADFAGSNELAGRWVIELAPGVHLADDQDLAIGQQGGR